MTIFTKGEYTHDLMILQISKLYPDLVHGRDFLVAHSVDVNTNLPLGDPRIVDWRNDSPKPDADELKADFIANRAALVAEQLRIYRDQELSASDSRTYMPPDAPAAIQESVQAWVDYRKALRDLPNQAGFPLDVKWPRRPF